MAESKREALRYRIVWTRPNDHLFDIRIEFTAGRRNPELALPVWRPGRYLRQNYAANVRQWRARIAGGQPLLMDKTEPSRWRVEAARGDRIVVEYRFYAGVLDAGSSFLDESEAYFNGSNLFMMVALQRQRPIELEIAHPATWRVETQLESTDELPGAARRKARGTIWRARDFDHLIDSPTIASPSLIIHAFKESGATIHLVFQSAVGIDPEQYMERVVAGSPAAAAGLRPNDEIIAVGQRRIASKNDLDRVLKTSGVKPVPILLARNREIIQREVAPAEDPSFTLELRPREKATPAEERRRREWLETDE